MKSFRIPGAAVATLVAIGSLGACADMTSLDRATAVGGVIGNQTHK